jgi:hypothetical protein
MISALVGLGLLFLIGVVVFIVVKIVQTVYTAGPALKEDWAYLSKIRARDAATVEAEKTAGSQYLSNLSLTITAEEPAPGEKDHRIRLKCEISDNGLKNVLSASVNVTLYPASADEQPVTRKIDLFNATATSVTPDKRLAAGEKRTIARFFDAVPEGFKVSKVEYDWQEVRLDIGKE